MDDKNQILDVTYGQFSCSLEGFEDSVETMKLVVTFFHDLAGHDKFMDTALLAPDMDTLERLTEEQTGQPVEIEATEEKISLRVRPDVAEEDAEEDIASSFDAEPETALDTPAADEYFEDEEDAALEPSDVAAKLERMREAAKRKMAAPAGEDVAEDLAVAAAPAVNPLSQRLSELAKRTVEAETAHQDDDAETLADDEPEAEQPFIEEDSVAEAAFDVGAEEEVQHEEKLDAAEINVFSDLTGDADQEADSEDDISTETEADHDDLPEVAEASEDDADVAVEDDIEEVEAAAEQDDMQPVKMADDDAGEVPTVEDDQSFDEELEAFLAAEDDAEDDIATEQPVTRVIADEPADTAEDDTTEDTPKDEAPLVLTADDQADEDHDDYNDDDEFDLEKEVAKVEAEIAARKGNEFARRGLPRHVEDAMSRIMSQTDQHLNQPENRRHRDAFAQLKAAVAATEAARQLGDDGGEKRDPDEAYKDDLGAHDASEKSDGKSAPPLKLVKSQEVQPDDGDTAQDDAAAAAEPAADTAAEPASARLRQIATQIEAEGTETEDNGGFAAFAAAHGATDLVDRLEAAGAYICLVEGENDFSRPQVMKVVQSASDGEISREDGLRSFGRLLRQARLVKLANGRFQVAENTQYRPDSNHVAQG